MAVKTNRPPRRKRLVEKFCRLQGGGGGYSNIDIEPYRRVRVRVTELVEPVLVL